MEIERAIAIINNGIVFKPGWEYYAKDFTSRHEGCICLYVEGVSRETSRRDAQYGYPTPNRPRATFLIQVSDLDHLALYREVLKRFIAFDIHEDREFFRTTPDYDAPFHPHRIIGMREWGDIEGDLSFGFNGMEWNPHG
jgi:hypothetical protein